jgi:hypothetical protein
MNPLSAIRKLIQATGMMTGRAEIRREIEEEERLTTEEERLTIVLACVLRIV